jgi:hypothetical protein
VAVGVRGWVEEVTDARTGPEEASADRFRIGVDQLTVARMADMAVTFLGTAATRSIEAGLHRGWRSAWSRRCAG